MIGHVERIEACRRIGGKIGCGACRIELGAALLLIGDLPEAGDEATDFEPRRQFHTIRSHTHAATIFITISSMGPTTIRQ